VLFGILNSWSEKIVTNASIFTYVIFSLYNSKMFYTFGIWITKNYYLD